MPQTWRGLEGLRTAATSGYGSCVWQPSSSGIGPAVGFLPKGGLLVIHGQSEIDPGTFTELLAYRQMRELIDNRRRIRTRSAYLAGIKPGPLR